LKSYYLKRWKVFFRIAELALVSVIYEIIFLKLISFHIFSIKGTPIDKNELYEKIFTEVEQPFAISKSFYSTTEIGNSIN
jgi:hypothetical protein